MEYGDEELRVLTEIDEIEKQRQLFHFERDGEERTILLDGVGHRSRWDFAIEHPIYGKLVCSYYPDAAKKQLQGYFGSGFAQERDGEQVIPGLMHWSCTDAGMEYLLKHIQQGLHDALCGLVMEAQIHGLFARNGHEFMISNLSQKKEINQVRNYYRARMNERLGTRQGRRKDMVDFLIRAYRAYCDVADELKIPITDPFIRDSTARVTQEKLVGHMKRKRIHNEESEITVRAFTKQLKEYGLTYSELIERCHYTRWKDGQKIEPENESF